MATLIQVRRDTQANWTANDPILASGEIAFSTDQYKIKIGDGTSNWSSLAYMTATPTEITNQINAAVSGLIDSAPETLDTLNELAAALGDDPTFFSTVATNLSNHEADTTNVHGIADTSLLATTSYVDTAESDAVASANSYSDSLSVNYDASGSAASAQAAAESYADSLAVNYDPAGSAAAAESNANSYSDGLASNYDASGSASAAQTAAESYSDSLAINYDPVGSAASAESNANSYSDSLAVNYDAAGSASTAESNANSYTDGEISTHNADTTNVHGISDTSLLATTSYVDTAESDAVTSANSYTDSAIGTHNSDTTSVHGISNTANLVYTDDSRLSDARTPTAHTHPTSDITNFTEDVQDVVGGMVGSNTESGIAVTYDDETGKLNFDVSDPTLTFTGDATGSGTVTNLGNTSIELTVADNSHNHTASNISDFTEATQDVVGGMIDSNTESGISVSYDDETGKLNFDVSDPTITLSGDVTGTATMTDLGNVTITTTVAADSVALGTDTTGDYVESVSGTDGVSVTGTGEGATVTVANTDKGSSQNIFKNVAVSGQNSIVADSNNDTLTFAEGTGITLTTDSSTDTITVTNAGVTSVNSSTGAITNVALTTGKLSQFAATTSSELAGVVSDETGTGALVFAGSPTLTGTPAAPTANAGTNTTQIATTAFVQTAVSNLVDSAPTTLDTLNELAAALNDDPNFATTVTNSIAGKQPLDADLTAIAALSGTSGFLKKTAADTWSLDTNTYLTGNQTITLTGDVSGSGTTSITVTVADDSHNHIISNVDGLQTALDAKAPLNSPTFTGTVTAATLDLTTAVTATVASHYWVATGSDGVVRPKTLANVRSEVVTNAAVNSAAATTVGTVTSGTWNGSVIGDSYIDTGIARLASPSFTGSITLDSKVNVDTASTTVSATTATTIDTLSASSYRSAEYLVQVTQGTKQTVSKIIMIHDGTAANISEYGVIELGETRIPLTLSATISGGNVLLQATIADADATNATVEVVRTAIVL